MASDIESIIKWMDELSNQHISIPKVAGPPTWKYLHTLAKLTPPDKTSQNRAFTTLKQVIETFPCSTCSEHGMEYISTHPFTGNLQEYVCDFHNTVNEHLGKPIHACDIGFSQLPEADQTRILSRGTGKSDNTIVEAVPYAEGEVGISIPISPLPGAPSIEFSVGNDFPWTIFPIHANILNRIANPWHYERPLTPREQLVTMFDEEDSEQHAAE